MAAVFDAVDAYRAAFSYRDVPAEVDLLLAWHERHGSGSPGAVLELAAGPGDHALEFARRGVAATALDLSAAMCACARQRAAAAGLPLVVVHADMTDFRIAARFDLAILLLDSASLVVSDAAMAGLFASVARPVDPGALLVIDLSVDQPGDRRPDWTIDTGEISVRTRWGAEGDAYDPATGVEQSRVRITTTRRGETEPRSVVDDIVPSRRWTGPQLAALAAPEGWELLARYGSLDRDVEFGSPGTDRDVLVLRRGLTA
jgi:hypothetical protein